MEKKEHDNKADPCRARLRRKMLQKPKINREIRKLTYSEF